MTAALTARIAHLTGQRPVRLSALSGGCVGDVYRVHMASGSDFVAKIAAPIAAPNAPPSTLGVEGKMLHHLHHHTDLPVPTVIHADDALLLMTFVPNDGALNRASQQDAARHIADLHRHTSPNGFGFAHDTTIGGLPQTNPWTQNWCDFFRDQRLMAMGHMAERAGQLRGATLLRLEHLCDHLTRWIDQPARPALIHGDLWGGNILTKDAHISGFIDPALYFADPEIELAFSTLFNTFDRNFFDRYQDVHPIAAGFFEQRRDLYNLYPLLVHVRLFGGAYGTAVERTLKQFGF